MDALRAFAMIMGVVLHSCMFYLEDAGPKLAYEMTGDKASTPTSDFLGMIFMFIHSWRMPVFFLIAGFFARLVVHRRRISGLLKNRFVRILVPLIVVSLVYNIIFQFGALNQTHHLWFLHDLIWMYTLLLIIRLSSKIMPSMISRIDWIFESTTRLWLLMILLIPTTFTGRPLFFNFIFTNIGIPGPFFTLGFSYFLIGWFMHRNTHILDSLSRVWRMHALIGLVTYGVFVTIMVAVLSDNFDEDSAGGLWILGMLIQPVVTFLLVMAFIGGTQAIFQRSNKVVSYFVDSSYWVYLLHLFVVFFIGGEIIKTTNPNPLVGAGVNIFATTLICMVTYHVLVRYTPIGWVLHGKKGPFSRLFKPFSREDVSAENGRT